MIPKKLVLFAMCVMGGCAMAQMPGGGAQHVQVEKAVKGKDSVSRRSIGHVEAKETVHVRAAVEGFIMEMKEIGEEPVKEGGIVHKNEILFVINPVRYEAARRQAKAAVEEIEAKIKYAEANRDRLASLSESAAISTAEFESAQANVAELQARLKEAEANLKKAEKDLDDCTVKAKITGRIGRVAVSPGNYVMAGETLATITQTTPIHVRFPLSQRDVDGIFHGPEEIGKMAQVKLTTAEGRRYPHIGSVAIVDNQLAGDTDTYRLWAEFPNEDDVLTPGGIGALRIELGDNQEVVMVPLTAIHHDPEGAFVYVLGADDIVERRPVSPGNISGRMQSVYSGLEAGEVVVTDGSHKIRVGAKVARVYPEDKVMRGGKKGKLADIPTEVATTHAVLTSDPTVITCHGARVEAINRIDLRPLVHGHLQTQNFEDGDLVGQGEKLFTIDSTRYQATVDAQRARITQLEERIKDARKKLTRLRKLLDSDKKEKATSEDEVQSAEAAVEELEAQKEGAEAALVIAEDDLSRCTIHAGMSGRIGRVTVTKGNYISDTRTPLAVLLQESPIYVCFPLSETAILGAFGNSQQLIKEADITLVTANGVAYDETGVVAFCDNTIQSDTGTRNVWATFQNKDGALRHGGVVTIHIQRKPEVKVMSLPAAAVQTGSGGHYVYVMKDGRAVATRVWCGDQTADGRNIIIYSGISEEDEVIISHLAELEDGDAVTKQK